MRTNGGRRRRKGRGMRREQVRREPQKPKQIAALMRLDDGLTPDGERGYVYRCSLCGRRRREAMSYDEAAMKAQQHALLCAALSVSMDGIPVRFGLYVGGATLRPFPSAPKGFTAFIVDTSLEESNEPARWVK